VPAVENWTDGLAAAVAWDAVSSYVVYDSTKAYHAASRKRDQSKKDAG
jgi:hypothetical protein